MKKLALIFVFNLFSLSSLMPLDFDGIFQVDYYGLIDPSTFYESERIRITVVPELKGKSKSKVVDFHLSGIFYLQPVGEPQVIDLERIIREAYLGFHYSIFDINLGQKFVNWGKVDILSPLNVVNHSDTTVLSTDNLLEASLPDLLTQIQIYPLDNFNIEIIYVPFLQPNIYEIEEIRIEQTFTLGTQQYNVDAAFIDREIPLFSEWAHSLYVAANYTSYLFDLIVSYSYYVDNNLDFDLSEIKETIVGTTHTITGTAYPGYNRVHNIGLGVSFYVGNLLFSADSAMKITRDWEGSVIEIKNSELFSALQVERMFRNRVRGHLNLYHHYVFNYDTPIQSPYSPLIQNYILVVVDDYLLQKPQSQFYFLLHLDTHFFREKLLLGANLIYGYTEKGYYLVPRVTYKVSDHINLSAGADIWMKGDIESFLGRNESRDNFFIRAQYAW